MAKDTLVLVRKEPPITIVELDRKQKRNALNIALRDELEARLAELEADERTKAVVLTGGEDAFSAGFDLGELVSTELRALSHRAVEFTERTYFFKKPLVAAVGGFAFAGGFDLALSGDVIVASEGAKLGRPEVQWGINPLLTKLSQRIGIGRALRLTLSGATVSAEEALAIGLVDRVVPRGKLLESALIEAEEVSRAPLAALVAVKRASRAVSHMDPRTALEHELGISAELMAAGGLREQLREYARQVGVLKE